MLHPGHLGHSRGLDAPHLPATRVGDDVADEIDVLLAREDHLALHAGTLGPRDHEHVREAGDHHAEIGLRTVLPFFIDGKPALALDVDLFHGAGHGVETGREYDRVDLMGFAVASLNAPLRDLFDRALSDVDQLHVRQIVGLVVARIEDQPLGADGMVVRAECLGSLGILDGLEDFVSHEVGGCVVGRLVGKQIIVGVEEADRATLLPLPLVGGVALLLRHLES